jgi:hypothetical protein
MVLVLFLFSGLISRMKKAAPQGGCGVRREDARLRNNDDRDRR